MSFRFALQQYIDKPEQKGVVFHDDKVVIVEDQFPKSLRHYLVMPRSKAESRKHPLEALRDPTFYNEMEEYVEKAKDLLVESLVPEFVEDSKQAKEEFRDSFIQCGVHSIPSMSNMHIHVMTKDFYLERMKNKTHYNSFNTSFFAKFSDLRPAQKKQFLQEDGSSSGTDDSGELSEDGIIIRRNKAFLGKKPSAPWRRPDTKTFEKIIRETPLRCVYCGEVFDFRFQQLKKHLGREFEVKFGVR